MDKKEILKELEMTYEELTNYLQTKYGVSQYNYFRNDSFASKNPKVSRGKEGLFCHHVDEDKAIMLSNPNWAKKNPYSYQNADRLVYCNYLEHLLLHLKIIEEPRHPNANEKEIPGIGGIVNFIVKELNDFYTGYEIKKESTKIAFELVKENLDEYIIILKRVMKVGNLKKEYSNLITRDVLSRNWDMTKNKIIYRLLK